MTKSAVTRSLEALLPGVFSETRDVVKVTGRDAETFLQGQISQDLERVVTGGSAWTFLLQPGGKVECFGRVSRRDEAFWLDVESGHGDELLQRLKRYCLRVDVKLELASVTFTCVRSLTSPEVAPTDALLFAWGPVVGADQEANLPNLPNYAVTGARELTRDEVDFVRIAMGLPALGSELNQSTIPAQIDVVNRAISMQKGCYTGQELVTRIASRGGNVPSKLRVIEFDPEQVSNAAAEHVVPGDEIMSPPTPGRSSRKVGTLTSVASINLPTEAGELTTSGEDAPVKVTVAMGFVRREVFPPYDALVRTGSGDLPCRIVELVAEREGI